MNKWNREQKKAAEARGEEYRGPSTDRDGFLVWPSRWKHAKPPGYQDKEWDTIEKVRAHLIGHPEDGGPIPHKTVDVVKPALELDRHVPDTFRQNQVYLQQAALYFRDRAKREIERLETAHARLRKELGDALPCERGWDCHYHGLIASGAFHLPGEEDWVWCPYSIQCPQSQGQPSPTAPDTAPYKAFD